MATIDQQFVEYIVKTLVNNPDKVKIDRTIDGLERDLVRKFPQITRIFIEPENLRETTKAAERLETLVSES